MRYVISFYVFVSLLLVLFVIWLKGLIINPFLRVESFSRKRDFSLFSIQYNDISLKDEKAMVEDSQSYEIHYSSVSASDFTGQVSSTKPKNNGNEYSLNGLSTKTIPRDTVGIQSEKPNQVFSTAPFTKHTTPPLRTHSVGTKAPTFAPTAAPTVAPPVVSTVAPSVAPSVVSTTAPTSAPTTAPTVAPPVVSTAAPTVVPTVVPTVSSKVASTVTNTVASTVSPTNALAQKKKKKKKSKAASYYPPDHVYDDDLLRVTKVLNQRMFKWLSSFQLSIPDEARRYASYRQQLVVPSPRDFMTEEEKQEINKLTGPARMRKVEQVMKTCTHRMNKAKRRKMEKLEKLYDSLVYYSPGQAVCDGCLITPLPSPKNEGAVAPGMRYFVGNNEKTALPKDIYAAEDATSFEITAIFVTTLGRIDFIPQLLYRWRGKIILVAYISTIEHSKFTQFIHSRYIPNRLTIIEQIFLPRKHPEFPVNSLRNLGISHCVTSHYIVLDMDVWLSESSYAQLKEIPTSVLSQPKTAIILPLFFFDRALFLDHCSSLFSCLLMALEYFPKTKDELTACIANSLCLASKMGIRTHLYITPEWYRLPANSSVSRVKCFIADFQEPYVILRRDADTPLFNRFFTNYGYNKVQHFEHLRAAGFQFYILNNAFAMDLPHPDSTYRKNYTQAETGVYSLMRRRYISFQNFLNKEYSTVKTFPVCDTILKNYYD